HLRDGLLEVVEVALERAPIVALPRGAAVVVEEVRRAARTVGRQAPGEGQVVARLVVGPRLFECASAFAVDRRRGRVGPSRRGVRAREKALRLDEQAPARTETPQGVVQARARRDELRVERAREIGAA